MKANNILIIDGSNLMHRSYWVSSKHNRPIVSLFLGSIRKLNNDHNPTEIYLAWDTRLIKGEKNYRRSESTEYKSNRDKDNWKKVYEHEKEIREVCSTLGVKNIYPGILEADDIISHLCDILPGTKTIVTSDHDMLQLISNKVSVYNPMRKIEYNHKNFHDHFPVTVQDFLHYKALIGDKSDNIAGIPGIGPKRAVRIIKDGIESSLNTEQLAVYNNNYTMVDLKEGLKRHPQEIDIYNYQVKELNKLKPNPKQFAVHCENHTIEHSDSFSSFFKNDINNAVLDILT